MNGIFLFREAHFPFILDAKPGRGKKNCFVRNIKMWMWSLKGHINVFMKDVSQQNMNFFLALISRI